MVVQTAAAHKPIDLLLRILTDPSSARELTEVDWDRAIRIGRSNRLLGTLRSRLDRAGVLSTLPPGVRQHLESDHMLARYQRQMVLHELRAVANVLAPLRIPLIALKGAAYILQGLSCSQGRFISDLDLMVPRNSLEQAEAALKAAGWELKELDPYDEHYYRTWSHELPPLQRPGHNLELDLHHSIVPLTARVRPNIPELFERSVPVADTVFRVLSPADQVLHACAHLAQESDFDGRLRDLVDIDALIREFQHTPQFWDDLLHCAQLHGLGRSLWHSMRYCSAWLSTPIPGSASEGLQRWAAPRAAATGMSWLVRQVVFASDLDRGPSFKVKLARALLLLRSHWLRMPPWLLVRHATVKAIRRLRHIKNASSEI
jgi:hypothetical protein